MSKLYDKGITNLDNAEYNFLKSKSENTDVRLCLACFNLQQAMEYFLNYLVELSGNSPIENHNLRAQVNKLYSTSFKDDLTDVFDKIDTKSNIYNSWEIESRHNDNFIVRISDINEAIEICHILCSYIKGLVQSSKVC